MSGDITGAVLKYSAMSLIGSGISIRFTNRVAIRTILSGFVSDRKILHSRLAVGQKVSQPSYGGNWLKTNRSGKALTVCLSSLLRKTYPTRCCAADAPTV